MASESDKRMPDPKQVEAALEAFQRGSPAEFDNLLAESEGGESDICSLFADLVAAPPAATGMPRRIGEYEIIREIGAGGMAVVYEARQMRTGMTVAIKVIRRWMAGSERQVRMFRREVDTLARLKHPNIATLFDAGRTEDGSHYFCMEFVNGVTLSEYLAQRRRKEGGRPVNKNSLSVLAQVCEAMNYAHQRGVIHRDLKPSNIIVDSRGVPKILDFGLARLIDPDLSTMMSLGGGSSIIGTLAYMSPEQARGELDRIDIRTDVYSLGVMLYEFATNRLPCNVRGLGVPAAVAAICGSVPQRPRAIDRRLAGDLETIILKAIEKDRDRRYQSADALANDIRRYLGNQPILARGPSALYQFGKLVSRHRLTSGLIAAITLIVTASAITFGALAAQLAEERDHAKAQADHAENINRVIGDMLASIEIKEATPSSSIQNALAKTAVRVDMELADQPMARASIHNTLGRTYLALRLYDQAQSHFQAALDLRRAIFGDESREYANSLHQMGVLFSKRSPNTDDGSHFHEKAYEIRRRLFGEEHLDVAESLHDFGCRFRYTDPEKADELLRRALAIRRKLLGEHPLVAETLQQLGVTRVSAGRYDAGEEAITEALAIQRKLLGKRHHDVAVTLTDLGEIYLRRSHYDQASQVFREEVEILENIFPNGNRRLSHAFSDLALILSLRGEFKEAESLHRQAVKMEKETTWHGRNELTANNFAVFLWEQGRYFEAEPHATQVLAIWGSDIQRDAPAKGYSAQNMGRIAFELSRIEEAETHFNTALRVWRNVLKPSHPQLAVALTGMARIRMLKGDADEAEQMLQEAYDVRVKHLGETHRLTGESLIRLALVMAARGVENADDMCAAPLSWIENTLGEDSERTAWALSEIASIQATLGRPNNAETNYRKAIAIERSLEREKHPVLAVCLRGLGEILMDRDESAAAEPLLREALDIQQLRYVEDDRRTAMTMNALGACLCGLGRLDEAESLLTRSDAIISQSYPPNHALSRLSRNRLKKLETTERRDPDAS